jgi:hypothetical protein
MDKNQKLARPEPGKAAPAGQRPNGAAAGQGEEARDAPAATGQGRDARRAREEFLVRRAGDAGDRPRPQGLSG